MFPNVRLMVMAVTASVVALSCGFGIFAAYRVNHEPLSRLPAGDPLHFVADNTTPGSMTLAAEGAFGSPVQSREAQSAAPAASFSSLTPDRRDDAVPPKAIAAHDAAAQQSAAPASQSATEPAADAAAQPPPQPQQVPVAAASTDAPTQPPAVPAVAAITPLQNPNTVPDRTVDGIAGTSGALLAAPTPDAAADDQPVDQAQPVEQATPAPKFVHRKTAKRGKAFRKIARRRVTPKPHRRVALSRAPLVTQFTSQNSAFSQPNFQFVAQPTRRAAPPAVRRQVLVVTQPRPTRKSAVRRVRARKTAAGGPFAGPPAQ